MALVAEFARRDGNHEAAMHFDRECEKKLRSEAAEKREWQRKLHGR